MILHGSGTLRLNSRQRTSDGKFLVLEDLKKEEGMGLKGPLLAQRAPRESVTASILW